MVIKCYNQQHLRLLLPILKWKVMLKLDLGSKKILISIPGESQFQSEYQSMKVSSSSWRTTFSIAWNWKNHIVMLRIPLSVIHGSSSCNEVSIFIYWCKNVHHVLLHSLIIMQFFFSDWLTCSLHLDILHHLKFHPISILLRMKYIHPCSQLIALSF